MTLHLSVLDLSPIPSGASAGQALRNTVDLARHVDALGYRRYWLAEHHNAGSLASSAPEIMIGQVAAATERLRVGAGGIMLPNHSALKVAELFRVLHALFPGRIDLGLGRAAGTDPRTATALRRGGPRGADEFPEQVRELLGFLGDDGPPRAPFTPSVRAIPRAVPPPDLWILGSSEFGGAFAARHGLGFAFAHHMSPEIASRELRAYRATFQPSPFRATPECILTMAAICAESDDEARELEACAALGVLRFAQGQRDLPMPSLDEARAHVWSADDRALTGAHGGRMIIGTPDVVGAKVIALARDAEVDEVMIMTHTHDHATRKRSYTRIAEAVRAAG